MKITAYVIFVHTLIIVAALYIHPTISQKNIPKSITVTTHQLIENESELAQRITIPFLQPTTRSPPTLPTPPTPRAEPTPTALPPHMADPPKRGGPPLPAYTPPPQIMPPAHPSVKSVAKTETPLSKSNHDKLIAMAQNSLQTLQSVEHSAANTASKKTITSKKTIGSLASEVLTFEAQYEQEVAAYLAALFSFPEKGEVKVKLTLKREGNVLSFEILKSSSAQNHAYVASSLPSCCFPPFGSHFKGENTHTFTINLKSE